MNLLTSSELKLDRQQEKAIYELTLKKQRSKKSTMSEKQVAAMQQLASELVSQRKDFRELLDYSATTTTNRSNQNALNHHQNHHNQHQLCRCSESTLALAAVAAAAAAAASEESCEETATASHLHRDTNSTGSESTASSSSGASTSSSRSAASLSPSSSSASDIPREQVLHITGDHLLHKPPNTSSGQQTQANLNSAQEQEQHTRRQRRPLSPTAEAAIIARHKNPISGSSFISTTSTNFSGSSALTTSTSSLMSNETNIKLSQLRLEQLNNELERRLHQYEYLVAQEKAILGAYKMNLFTNEGVNNFHLFSLDQRSQYYK